MVGGVKEGREGTAIGLYETSRKYQVGVLHEGLVEAYEMFDKEATCVFFFVVFLAFHAALAFGTGLVFFSI